MLFLSSALAQEAQDLSEQCVVTATNQKMAFRLTDGRVEKAYEARKHTVNEIEFTLPEGESAFGLYMIWKMDSAQVALDIYDPETETYAFFANVNNGKFVHEYMELPGAQRFTSGPLRIPEAYRLRKSPFWVKAHSRNVFRSGKNPARMPIFWFWLPTLMMNSSFWAAPFPGMPASRSCM